MRNYQQLFDLYMNSIQLLFLYPLILTFFIIEYVEFLVDIANNKLEDNQTRIDRYIWYINIGQKDYICR